MSNDPTPETPSGCASAFLIVATFAALLVGLLGIVVVAVSNDGNVSAFGGLMILGSGTIAYLCVSTLIGPDSDDAEASNLPESPDDPTRGDTDSPDSRDPRRSDPNQLESTSSVDVACANCDTSFPESLITDTDWEFCPACGEEWRPAPRADRAQNASPQLALLNWRNKTSQTESPAPLPEHDPSPTGQQQTPATQPAEPAAASEGESQTPPDATSPDDSETGQLWSTRLFPLIADNWLYILGSILVLGSGAYGLAYAWQTLSTLHRHLLTTGLLVGGAAAFSWVGRWLTHTFDTGKGGDVFWLIGGGFVITSAVSSGLALRFSIPLGVGLSIAVALIGPFLLDRLHPLRSHADQSLQFQRWTTPLLLLGISLSATPALLGRSTLLLPLATGLILGVAAHLFSPRQSTNSHTTERPLPGDHSAILYWLTTAGVPFVAAAVTSLLTSFNPAIHTLDLSIAAAAPGVACIGLAVVELSLPDDTNAPIPDHRQTTALLGAILATTAIVAASFNAYLLVPTAAATTLAHYRTLRSHAASHFGIQIGLIAAAYGVILLVSDALSLATVAHPTLFAGLAALTPLGVLAFDRLKRSDDLRRVLVHATFSLTAAAVVTAAFSPAFRQTLAGTSHDAAIRWTIGSTSLFALTGLGFGWYAYRTARQSLAWLSITWTGAFTALTVVLTKDALGIASSGAGRLLASASLALVFGELVRHIDSLARPPSKRQPLLGFEPPDSDAPDVFRLPLRTFARIGIAAAIVFALAGPPVWAALLGSGIATTAALRIGAAEPDARLPAVLAPIAIVAWIPASFAAIDVLDGPIRTAVAGVTAGAVWEALKWRLTTQQPRLSDIHITLANPADSDKTPAFTRTLWRVTLLLSALLLVSLLFSSWAFSATRARPGSEYIVLIGGLVLGVSDQILRPSRSSSAAIVAIAPLLIATTVHNSIAPDPQTVPLFVSAFVLSSAGIWWGLDRAERSPRIGLFRRWTGALTLALIGVFLAYPLPLFVGSLESLATGSSMVALAGITAAAAIGYFLTRNAVTGVLVATASLVTAMAGWRFVTESAVTWMPVTPFLAALALGVGFSLPRLFPINWPDTRLRSGEFLQEPSLSIPLVDWLIPQLKADTPRGFPNSHRDAWIALYQLLAIGLGTAVLIAAFPLLASLLLGAPVSETARLQVVASSFAALVVPLPHLFEHRVQLPQAFSAVAAAGGLGVAIAPSLQPLTPIAGLIGLGAFAVIATAQLTRTATKLQQFNAFGALTLAPVALSALVASPMTWQLLFLGFGVLTLAAAAAVTFTADSHSIDTLFARRSLWMWGGVSGVGLLTTTPAGPFPIATGALLAASGLLIQLRRLDAKPTDDVAAALGLALAVGVILQPWWSAPIVTSVGLLAVSAASAGLWLAIRSANPLLTELWALSSAILATLALGAPQPTLVTQWITLSSFILLAVTWAYRLVTTTNEWAGYLAGFALIGGYVYLRTDIGLLPPQADPWIAQGAGLAILLLESIGRHEDSETRRVIRRVTLVVSVVLPAIGWLVSALTQPEFQPGVFATGGSLYLLIGWQLKARGVLLPALLVFNAEILLAWLRAGVTHPVLYALPVGLTPLVCARVFADRLGQAGRNWLRAFGCIIIYAASSYQLFLFDDLQPVLLTAGLGLVGVLAGLLLRVRAYLYSGTFGLIAVLAVNLFRVGARDTLVGSAILFILGLLMLAAGVAYNVRRQAIRDRLASLRSTLEDWD